MRAATTEALEVATLASAAALAFLRLAVLALAINGIDFHGLDAAVITYCELFPVHPVG